MLYLCKLISTFYRNYPEKGTVIFPLIDSTPLMARPTVKPRAEASSIKQKYRRSAKANGPSKRAKKTWTSNVLSCFWPCLNSRQKIPSVTWFFAPLYSLIFDSYYFLIFTHFSIFFLGIDQEVFSPKYLDLSIFLYQFLKGFESFSSIDPPVFFYHLLLEFWKFFTYVTATPKLVATFTYMFIGTCALEKR